MTDAKNNPIINEHYTSLERIKKTKRDRVVSKFGEKVGGTTLQASAGSEQGDGNRSFISFQMEGKGYTLKSFGSSETKNPKLSANEIDNQAKEHGKYSDLQRKAINNSVRVS